MGVLVNFYHTPHTTYNKISIQNNLKYFRIMKFFLLYRRKFNTLIIILKEELKLIVLRNSMNINNFHIIFIL